MIIDKKTVEYVANLARIELTEDELKTMSLELKDILDFIGKLNELKTDEVAPTSHILPVSNILRKDLPGQSLSSEEATANAPSKENGFFGVPKVIE